MDSWAREQRRIHERRICEARGISLEQLWTLYAAKWQLRGSNYSDLDALRTLLLLGYDINRDRGNEGETLLMLVARRGQTDAVSFLISQGADVNLQDMYGFTALMWAAVSGNSECVRLLLESGADPRIESEPTCSELATALSLADRYGHADVRAEIERVLREQ